MDSINILNAVNSLNTLNDITFQTIKTNPKLNKPEIVQKSAFEEIYDATVKLLDDTSRLQIEDEQLQLDYASGKTDDMLAVVMAQQKAYSSLNFTVQVTNKLIDAYREIMRMNM